MNVNELINKLQELQAQGHGEAQVSYEDTAQRRVIGGMVARGYRFIQAIGITESGDTLSIRLNPEG